MHICDHAMHRSLCAAAYQAPLGTSVNLKEVLLNEKCAITVALAAATKVFSIKAAAFRQLLQDYPGLQQALFKDMSQQLTLSQATLQVLLPHHCCLSSNTFHLQGSGEYSPE